MVTLQSYARSASVSLLLFGFATPLSAAAAGPCEPRIVLPAASSWTPPLDRIISFDPGETSLEAALDRLAAASGLRFSYSPEQLPLERIVCASYRNTALGAVLGDLLDGVAVEPVIAAADHIVLAPHHEA
ncbi:MAG: hypothetical protein ACT443_07600, partial [Gemmatimonadota bacterium]